MVTISIDRTNNRRPGRRRSQFDALLRLCERIAVFIEENGAQQSKAYFALDNGTVGLYLVTTSATFDFELGDKLAEFAAPYVERGLISSVTLLPASTPEELAAYFDPKNAMRVEIELA